MSKTFQDTQVRFSDFLRSPEKHACPDGMESRRMAIYQELVYNNIESFIAGAFPVLKSLYDDDKWQHMIAEFVANHQCETPYFTGIAKEFLKFLMEEYSGRDTDFPFLVELAHYEWVELVLDISDEASYSGRILSKEELLLNSPVVSPLAWPLCYRYPVHQISESFMPDIEEPTFLVVYRDRSDKVRFMEINHLSYELLQLLGQGECDLQGRIGKLAKQAGAPDIESFIHFASDTLWQLHKKGIIEPAR